MNPTYQIALEQAIDMLNDLSDLEPTSALKEAANRNGIPWGSEMEKFVLWANAKLGI
jgi:hypothetical protein